MSCVTQAGEQRGLLLDLLILLGFSSLKMQTRGEILFWPLGRVEGPEWCQADPKAPGLAWGGSPGVGMGDGGSIASFGHAGARRQQISAQQRC